MQEFDKIGEDLFNKIRGRFPSITIGNEAGEVINEPSQARFFDFEYKEADKTLGNVSVNITEDEGMTIIYSKDFISNEDSMTKDNWYNFLKELRLFAKKRMLEFSIRDITKSNLTKRDYKFLSNRTGDNTMAESKLYGTSRISYQDVGSARLVIKHTESINQEQATGRTRSVGTIYIESSEGERFKYPYKHLNGARAMARHVAEGGNAYDDFGKHIVSLSEEQAKLSKFKRYMSRSAVMAESLSDYTDAVNDRIVTVKKTLQNLQKKDYYAETFESFAPAVMEDVPADVAENWIDQLTIRQFNEELKDIFPYVFKLVSEVSKAKDLGPDDLAEVAGPDKCWPGHRKVGTQPGTGKNKGKRVNKCKKIEGTEEALEQGFEEMMGQFGEGAMSDMHQDAQEMSKEEFIAKYGEQAGNDWENVQKDLEDNTMDVKIDKDGAISKDDGKAEKEQKTPLGEFILSYFDKETGEFPKGETAVLTMIEKDYGEQFIEPAKAFIEQVQAKFEEYQMQAHPQQMETDDEDDEDEDDDLFKDDEFTAMDQEDDDEVNKHFDRMRELAGLR
jgi:hypothetical protein